MKCLIKSLLGQDTYAHDNSDVCTPLPPIVKSLLGSIIFILLMAVLSHMLRL